MIFAQASSAFQAGQSPASSSPRNLALSFVSQSWEQLQQTPQNVVIVVISLQQLELRMTTFFRPKRKLKQLLMLSSLADDDAVSIDAMVAINPSRRPRIVGPALFTDSRSPNIARPTRTKIPTFSGTPRSVPR